MKQAIHKNSGKLIKCSSISFYPKNRTENKTNHSHIKQIKIKSIITFKIIKV